MQDGGYARADPMITLAVTGRVMSAYRKKVSHGRTVPWRHHCVAEADEMVEILDRSVEQALTQRAANQQG